MGEGRGGGWWEGREREEMDEDMAPFEGGGEGR
jgi:hypothetical protein